MPGTTITAAVMAAFADGADFNLTDAYGCVGDAGLSVNRESVRARIYEAVKSGVIERVSRGVYHVHAPGAEALLVCGDGRDLSAVADESVDAIVTDHPYDVSGSLDGGNRKFAAYERFRYEQADFDEKARVLRPGGFCAEFLPEESAANWRYLAEVKRMAEAAGLAYYAQVPWTKGSFVSNTGRKAHNAECVLFLTKGKARSLRPDNKRNLGRAKALGIDCKGLSSADVAARLERQGAAVGRMSGAAGMLPAAFDVAPPSRKERTHQAEKPVELLRRIIGFITLPGELVLDQFAGSGSTAVAALAEGRRCLAIEADERTYQDMVENVARRAPGHSAAA